MSKNTKNTMPLPYKLVPCPLYLSGNVRVKLTQAQTASAIDPLFSRNAELLTDIQPIDVPLTDIDTSFSSIWIPLSYFEAFIREVLEVRATVCYSDVNSAWSVTVTERGASSLPNTSTYGVEWTGFTFTGKYKADYKLTAVEMIEMAMNFKTPAITRRASPLSNMARDPNLTAGAIDKQRQLQERFTDWLRSDAERVTDLEYLYNHRFNNLRLPNFDGSHLTLPGMSDYWLSRIRDYQLNGIYRGMLGNAGIFDEVGLGKTLTGIATVMERCRIDPTTKAVIIVKKSTLKQFGNDFRKAYPNAKILVATSDDCNQGRRQLFMAQVASGNYNAVIMTHQAFEKLPLRPETLKNHIEPLLARVRKALAEHGIEDDEASNDRKKKKSFVVKNLERMRNRLKEKIKNIATTKDRGLFFEDLGINLIVADEADVYLNAPLLTKLQGIAGLSVDPSGIAIDFEWKIEWLRQTYGTGHLILMTGTFLRNTMANLYMMQRFLQPEALEARGIHCFDAWASLFGRIRTGAEVKTDGGIARKSRFSEFVNLPELLQMFFAVAQINRYDDVKDETFKRPEAKYVNVLAPMSETQSAVMLDLVKRSTDVRSFTPQEFYVYDKKSKQMKWKSDNLLWISTVGRKVSLDPRLIDAEFADFDKSKINMCARRVFKIWRKTQASRSTQMVFLDLSTPGKGFTLYRDLKAKWMQMGVPEDEIAFIQDYQSDQAKDDLFKAVNEGRVRILLGSTSMMGVGVNAQKKMIALHHLDCPWRPCDLEQREGRILRSGNENSRVLIYRYVTQGRSGNCGFDSFMWQLVEAKSRFIRQIMGGDLTIRRMVEDAGEDPTFSAGEIKALATGDMRIMRHVEVEAQLETLQRLERSINMDIHSLRHGQHNSIPWSRRMIEKYMTLLVDRGQDFDLVRERRNTCTGDAFKIRLLRTDYTDRKAAGEVLSQIALDLLSDESAYKSWRRVGHYGGMEILMMAPNASGRVEAMLRGTSGETYSVRFVRDKHEVANRIEMAYLEVLEVEADAHRTIVREQQCIAQFEAELDRKQHQLGDVRSQVEEFALEKRQLEIALGIDKDSANSEMEIGEDEEEE